MDVIKAFQFAQKVIPRRSPIPALACARVNGSVTATDLDVMAWITLDQPLAEGFAEVRPSLQCLKVGLPVRYVSEVAGNWPNDTPVESKKAYFRADAGRFTKLLSKCLLSTTADAGRYALDAILFDKGKAHAADGHRLVVMAVDAPDLDGLMLPSAAARLIVEAVRAQKAATVAIRFFDTPAPLGQAEIGDIRLQFRLAEGRFPNLELVIPKEPPGGWPLMVHFHVEDLKQRLTLAKIENPRSLMTMFEIEHGGQPRTFGFHAQYLLDIATQLGQEDFTMVSPGPEFQFMAANEDALCVILPMTI